MSFLSLFSFFLLLGKSLTDHGVASLDSLDARKGETHLEARRLEEEGGGRAGGETERAELASFFRPDSRSVGRFFHSQVRFRSIPFSVVSSTM